MRITRAISVQQVAQSFLALLTLLLGTAACNKERTPQPITTSTAHLSHKKDTMDNLMVTPLQSADRTVRSTATSTPFPTLNGSGIGVIAFQSDRDRQDEIYIMNADGSDQRLLISNQWAFDGMPAWSPDGKQIAFASRDRGKDFEICVVRVADDLQVIEGKVAKQLTDNDYDDLHPTWSADGKHIAFVSKRESYSEIFVIDVDGTDEFQLTDNDVEDKDPAWSPYGTQIAYVSRHDGAYDIYVMESDGSDQRQLTDNQANELSPAWSPDGTQIAFISERNGEYHLFVMGMDGSNPRQLTDANYPWNDDPTWSPDGTQIAFRSNHNGYVDVYVMSVDGSSNPQQLTHNTEIDQDRAPAWRPIHSDLP